MLNWIWIMNLQLYLYSPTESVLDLVPISARGAFRVGSNSSLTWKVAWGSTFVCSVTVEQQWSQILKVQVIVCTFRSILFDISLHSHDTRLQSGQKVTCSVMMTIAKWRYYTKVHWPGSALPSPAYCFVSVVVWTENKNVTISDQFVIFWRWNGVGGSCFEEKSASGWPGWRIFWPRNDLAP